MSPTMAQLAKFFSRVAIPSHAYRKKCWIWQGAVTTDRPGGPKGGWGGGYGCLKVQGKWRRAHRWIWRELYGPIPEGMVIAHRCDNRLCVNPDHLELATLGENLKQAHDRGQTTGGQKGGRR